MADASSMILQPVQWVYTDFEHFAWKNNILASTVGFTIGMATKELIENASKHAGVPTIAQLYVKIMKKPWPSGPAAAPITWSGSLVLILLELLKWAGVLIMTFVIATYIMDWMVEKAKSATGSASTTASTTATENKSSNALHSSAA